MEPFLCHNLCDSGSGVIRTEGSESLSGPVERESASLTELEQRQDPRLQVQSEPPAGPALLC